MKKMQITVAALGPGDASLLTLGALQALKTANTVILRTDRHPLCDFLKEQGVSFTTLDHLYENSFDFDELNQAAAQSLWSAAKDGDLCYGVMDPVQDETVRTLAALAPKNGYVTILPGVSLAQDCQSALPLMASDKLRIIPAIAHEGSQLIPSEPMLITELNSSVLTSQVKLWLMTLYPDDMEVWFFPPSQSSPRTAKALPLMDLDRQKKYDHTTCIFVPISPIFQRNRFCFEDLVDIMSTLRGPGGCPWDLEQTHMSLRPYLLEEAYEAVDAINQQDPLHIADELGDVLLQIVFHASIGAQHGDFDVYDVTSAICQKMIYRHGHIFGNDKCATASDVSVNWESLKKKEKGLSTYTDALEDVPKGLPSLLRAWKILKKAAQSGFQYTDGVAPVLQALSPLLENSNLGENQEQIFGNILFALVHYARQISCQPELALSNVVEAFICRFASMENAILSDGKALELLTLSEMDVYWKMGKTQGRQA